MLDNEKVNQKDQPPNFQEQAVFQSLITFPSCYVPIWGTWYFSSLLVSSFPSWTWNGWVDEPQSSLTSQKIPGTRCCTHPSGQRHCSSVPTCSKPDFVFFLEPLQVTCPCTATSPSVFLLPGWSEMLSFWATQPHPETVPHHGSGRLSAVLRGAGLAPP